MKTETHLLYIFITIALVGCNPNVVSLKPKACFDYSPSKDLKTTDTIKFSNCSENSNYYYWDFGDSSYSYQKEPKHIFRSKQSYQVKLLVANRQETDTTNILESDTFSKSINISIDDIVSLNNSSVSYDGFSLSVDNDGIIDFIIKTDHHYGTTQYEMSSIESFNNYEIFSDSTTQNLSYKIWNDKIGAYEIVYSTKNVCIPKIYIIGDMIQNINKAENKKLVLCSQYSSLYEINNNNNWIKDEIRYIGFRKQYGNITRIGWIKLKVLNYIDITLYSFKIPTETQSLLIDK